MRSETRRFRAATEVWQAVASLIEELDGMDRCVEYSIDGSVQPYDRVDTWLADTVSRGDASIRYTVEPDHLGLVRVDFAAVSPGMP